MIEDISKLYQKIVEEQKESNKKIELIDEKESYQSETIEDLLESKEEPFDNFLSKLGEKLQEELLEKEPVIEDVEEEIEVPKNNYVNELQKIDKPSNKKVLKENEEITNIISEQIQEEIGKVKTQISRMAIEGGGGSVAVQYANGGTMRGDLNVTGKYLSGGIDLSTLIGSGGGGGGLSGTTDRLISGSEVFKLNTDGTFNFPNNIITPQDEVILTLESTKVLDNYYNRLALSPYGFFASDHNGNSITINSNDNEILIDSQNTYFWKFNNKGALEGPFGTVSISGNLSASGRIYQNGNDLQSEIESISGISISTKTTVHSNSASWNYQGSDIKALSSGWVGGNLAYTNLVANSAAYLSGIDLSFLSVSGNWNSAYTTVNSNSATTWNYQGTDLKNLSSDWVGGNIAYTNLLSNSAAYLSGYDLSFLSVSADWNSVYSTVKSNSAVNWNYQGSDIKALTSYWDSTYTTVQSNSASWAVDSTTDTGVRALTSEWVGGNSSYTTVQTYSASWGTGGSGGSNVSELSANWQSTYTTVSSNSAYWLGAYTTLQANSGTWGQSVSGVAQIMTARVYNADSVTMHKGDVVYTFGATGEVMSVKLASNVGDYTSSKTLGFVNGTIAVGGIGYVVIAGQIDKMAFPHPFEDGDALWLGATAGTFTRVKPTAPNHGVYLGVVERANNGNGLAYVKVQNGYELDEIHDVQITSVSAGQILRRNSSNNLWINTNDGDKWDSVYSSVTANSATWSAITSYSALIGNSTTNPITATHNLNTKDIVFSVREVTTDKIVYVAARTVDNNNLELTFDTTPSINQYDLTILSRGNSVSNNQGTTNVFSLTTISSNSYIQDSSYTHNLYNDTPSTGTITVYLLPPAYHIGVTQHKKIGSTSSVILSAPNGALIDGYPIYTLNNQYESIGLYTNGTNYFIQ